MRRARATSAATTSGPLSGTTTTLNASYDLVESGVRLTATATGGDALSPATSAPFNVSAIASRLTVTTINGGSNPVAGTAFTVRVEAQDGPGNSSSVVASTGFALSLGTGNGTLGGTLTGTIPAGADHVDVSGITYTKAESGVTLHAVKTSGDTLAAGDSSAFTVDAGAAARFAVVGAGTQTAGNPNALTITAYDANDNVAAGYTGDHAVTFFGRDVDRANNPTVTDASAAAIAFGTPTTVHFVNGVSTIGGSMTLVKAATATIVATAGAVTTTGVDRLTVVVSPALTDHFTVSAPTPRIAGSAFSATVTAKDQFGNVTPAYLGTATISSSDTQAVAPASITFTAPDAGIQSVSVTLKTAGTKTVVATDGSTTGSASVSVVAATALASATVLTAAPTSITADGVAASTITAQLVDAYGNALSSGGPAVTLSTDRGSIGSVTNNGDGTSSAALTSTLSGTAHVTGTVGGVTIGSSTPVTLTPGAVSAAGSHSSLSPASTTASTDAGLGHSATITVTVRDAFDNPIPGATVTLAAGSGSSNISPALGTTTDAAGHAIFTVDDDVAETVVYSATAAGTLLVQTASVQFLPGTPTQLVFGTQPTNAVAGATIAPAVTVRLLDAQNNLTTSTANVALQIKSGTGAVGATLAGTSTHAAAGGVATFNDLSIVKAATGYKLTASSAGITSTDSSSFDEAPGALDAGHSTITLSPGSIAADGVATATATVHARDANDNDLTVGGALVTLTSDLGTSIGSVTDTGSGTYTATVTAGSTSGSTTVTGTIGGTAIGHAATLTLQAQPTTVTVDSGAPPALTQATGATIAFHAGDASATFLCALDGGAATACSSPFSTTGLADGNHTLVIHAVNGNASTSRSTSAGPRRALPSAGDVEPGGQAEHLPQRRDPRADGHDDMLDLDRPAFVTTGVTALRVVEPKPVSSTPSTISAPARRAFSARPSIDSLLNAKPPACSCRQTVSPGARQSEYRLRMWRSTRLGAEVQLAGVADALLALEHLGQVALLAGRAERDVARRVVVQRLGIGLPDLHARGHELGHCGLEVVVAHDAAGDARRAGGDARLVDDEHLLAVGREVPGGREAVHARADDEVLDRRGQLREIGHVSARRLPALQDRWLVVRPHRPRALDPGARARAAGTSRGPP